MNISKDNHQILRNSLVPKIRKFNWIRMLLFVLQYKKLNLPFRCSQKKTLQMIKFN